MPKQKEINNLAYLLTKNTKLSSILTCVGLLLSFIYDLSLARSLDTRTYGSFNYVFVVATLVSVVSTLGIPVSGMKYISQYITENDSRSTVGFLYWSLLSTVAMATLAVVSSFVIYKVSIFPFKYEFVLSSILAFPLSLWLWSRFISLGFNDVTLALVPREIVAQSLLLLTLPIYRHWGINSIVFVNSAFILLAEVIAIAKIFSLVRVRYSNVIPIYNTTLWIRSSMFFNINSITQLGLNRIDILFLGALTNSTDVAFYYAASRLSQLNAPILRAFINAISPLLSSASIQGKTVDLNYIKGKSLRLLLVICGPIYLLQFFASPSILQLLYGEPYVQGSTVLRILIVGQLFYMASVPSSTFLWMGEGLRLLNFNTIFSLLLSLAVILLFLPCITINVVAIATTLSTVTLSILNFRSASIISRSTMQ